MLLRTTPTHAWAETTTYLVVVAVVAELCCQVGVVRVEGLLLKAAVHEHADDLALLLVLEAELDQLLKRVQIILSRTRVTGDER